MNPQDPQNEAFLDDLAPIVDGEVAAIERHADFLADSDDARDLRHDASLTARRVGGAGDDYIPPQDMAARVLAALDARSAGDNASVAPDTLPLAGAPSVERSYSGSQAPGNSGPVDATAATVAIPATNAQAGQHPFAQPAPTAQAPAAQTPHNNDEPSADPKKSRGKLYLILGTGLALAAAAAAAVVMIPDGATEATDPIVARAAGMTLTGTLATVVRASDEVETAGVSLGDGPDTRAIVQGASIAAGGVIRTDARTRAEVSLSDGSTIIIDRDSEVVVGGQGRSIELRSGQLLAEVAHLDDGPNAIYQTPSGIVEVLGTKFLLTASDGEAAVRVTRGVVRVRSEGESVEVKTGQEGLMRRGERPHVVPAMNLATSVAWSELDSEEDDLPVPGLGELRAHEPGEREETERELSLAHHGVTVRIVGNVARTEIAETFRNDSDDVLEGVYSFPMPPDARIASLSLKVDGEWQEGAFVSKERAQQIWRGVIRNATPERQRPQEEFIWVPGPWRDPALLEWQQGGRFQLKIFPIPAHGEREIRLSYEQTIAPHGDHRRYTYPMPLAADDSTRVGHFEVDVRVAGAAQAKSRGYEMTEANEDGSERLRFSSQNFSPSGDLIIDYEMPNGDSEMRFWTFQGDATATPPERTREDEDVLTQQRELDADGRGYALFALRPELPGWTEAQARDYVLVVDASQSMVGERYERAIRLAEGVIGEMDRRDRVYAVACDVECRAIASGPALPSSVTAAAVREFLEKEDPAGASDISASMRGAVRLASEAGAGSERDLHFIYVGDGIASVGHRRAGSLAAEVELALGEASAQLTTVGIGQGADSVALGAMARAGGGHYVPYVAGQRTSAAALAVLETTYGASLENAVIVMPEGVVSVAPAELPTIRSGQELLVSARVTRDGVAGDVVLRGTVGGRDFEQRYPVSLALTQSAGNAFVPRIWASKTIEDLQAGGRSEDTARVVALSKSFNVMSRETSLLVLESEAMFQAFGVDRARPSVQWTGEEDMVYGDSAGTNEVAGIGGLGLTGVGRGGGGVGEAATGASVGGLRARTRRAAPSRPATTSAAPMPQAAPMDDAFADVAEEEAVRERRTMPIGRGPRGGQWMRKVWFREGRISRDGVRERDLAAVAAAEEAHRANPDSRDRMRTLVRALSRAGNLERAEEMAKAWLDRDRLDPEALTYLSDVVGRRGERERAVRLLSGIVDLQPDDVTLQTRLANAFERAGKAERACAHRVSLAEIRPDDRTLVANAMRCERALGRPEAGERLLQRVEADERASVEAAAGSAPTPERVRGDLMATATWEGGTDIDLTLVTPQGTRLSWLGGRTNVVGEDATSTRRERVGLRRAGTGTYYIEVSRANPDDRTPIRGSVNIDVLGDDQSIDFELGDGVRQSVGQVSVVRRWRMENQNRR